MADDTKNDVVYFGGRLDKDLHSELKISLFRNKLTQQEFLERIVKKYINGEIDLESEELESE